MKSVIASFKGIMKLCLETDGRLKKLLKVHCQVRIVDLLRKYYKPWEKLTRARLPMRVIEPVTFLRSSRRIFSDLSQKFSTDIWLDLGKIPQIWRDVVVINLFKKGSRAEPSNYRSNFFFDQVGKVFAKIITNRADKFSQR